MLTFLLSVGVIVGLAAPAGATTAARSAATPVAPTVAARTAPIAAQTGLLLAPASSSSKTLKRGDRGTQVETLQRRLRDLHYWVGTIDGEFGGLTQQALLAFQKYEGLGRDGIYGPKTRRALAGATRPTAKKRSGSGTWVEIDKRKQTLMLVRAGKVKWVFNTSTGTEKPYTYKGRRYVADTPKGSYRVFRQVKGWRNGELGRLYNPKYFHPDGIAIHGYASVPPYPASHGCARISIAASRYLWSKIKIGTRVRVF